MSQRDFAWLWVGASADKRRVRRSVVWGSKWRPSRDLGIIANK